MNFLESIPFNSMIFDQSINCSQNPKSINIGAATKTSHLEVELFLSRAHTLEWFKRLHKTGEGGSHWSCSFKWNGVDTTVSIRCHPGQFGQYILLYKIPCVPVGPPFLLVLLDGQPDGVNWNGDAPMLTIRIEGPRLL